MDKHTTQLMCFFVWLGSLIFTNSYIIERGATNIFGQWIYQPDRFIIPSSNCSSGVLAQSRQCRHMGGSRSRNCICQCKSNRRNFFYALNVSNGGEWKCFENKRAHSYGGCKKVLDNSATSDPLVVMPMAAPKTIYYLPCDDQLSDIEYNYLKCDGTWEKMDTSVIYTDEDQGYLTYSVLSGNPNIGGRVVKMKFSCDSEDYSYQDCVLFKIRGTTTCPVMMPSTSSLLSVTLTTATSRLSPTQSSKVTSTVPARVVSSSLLSPSPASAPTMPSRLLLSTPSLHKQFSTSVSTAPSTTEHYTNPRSKSTSEKPSSGTETVKHSVTSPSLVNGNRGKSNRTEDDISGLIAGVVSGVIGLIIVVAVTALIIRKRQKRHANSKTTVLAENASYGTGVDSSLRFSDGIQNSPDEEYSYAYINTAPFASTSKPDAENDTTSNQGLDCNNSVANRIYGNAEGLNNPCSPAPEQENPVYSILEEPEYAQVDKSRKGRSTKELEYAKLNKSKNSKSSENSNEPLYNVLERPFENSAEKLNDESCYHVLEGPYSKDAPVYDVLEGPESDGAEVYGSLEGQDPHMYDALEMQSTRETFEENRENNDGVYDAVGDIINDQGDIYQQLNHNGQRNSDVYEALSHPDKTMHLKELNESISDA